MLKDVMIITHIRIYFLISTITLYTFWESSEREHVSKGQKNHKLSTEKCITFTHTRYTPRNKSVFCLAVGDIERYVSWKLFICERKRGQAGIKSEQHRTTAYSWIVNSAREVCKSMCVNNKNSLCVEQ